MFSIFVGMVLFIDNAYLKLYHRQLFIFLIHFFSCSSYKSIYFNIKVSEYFKCQITNNGIIFLQETHSSEDTFNEWQDNFKEV